MLITFSFAIHQESNEASWGGNVSPQVALQLLQQIVIAEEAKRLKEELDKACQEIDKQAQE